MKKLHMPSSWPLISLIVFTLGLLTTGCGKQACPQPLPLGSITTGGELQQRLERNFIRLEETKYQPANVFLTEAQSGGWPGDTEGRTILGITLDAQATGRAPLYLDEIIRLIPEHLNEKGYMGPIYEGKTNEQQLSGNGWMLRGLCEYYLWKGDPAVKEMISSIATNLFLASSDYFLTYPVGIVEESQGKGDMSGSVVAQSDSWMLSSDVGCVFIGMEGLIHAYCILQDEQLREPIDRLIDKFLQIDLNGIKAQTHATITACRGLIRYADATGEKRYIAEAEQRMEEYIKHGMTESYENYNWFSRFDKWTEPCAIIDSYMLAVQLWQHTGKVEYAQLAELIYYNAICHTQRSNGGFGCDKCPGLAIGSKSVAVHFDEAHWCCTMRGGEGLSRAAEYGCFSDGRNLMLPFLRNATVTARLKEGRFCFTEETEYPFESGAKITITENTAGKVALSLAAYSWMEEPQIKLNGEIVKAELTGGFITVKRNFKKGDMIEYQFNMSTRTEPVINLDNCSGDWRKVLYGPLVLAGEVSLTEALVEEVSLPADLQLTRLDGCRFAVAGTDIVLSPLYHLMDSRVWKGTGYKRQILF